MKSALHYDAAAWTAEQLERDRSWIYPIGDSVAEELDSLVLQARNAGEGRAEVAAESLPLPSAGPLVDALVHELECGRGLALVRGFPVERRAVTEAKLLFAGFCAHLGTSIVQDTAGTLLEEVTDRGVSYDNIEVRGYMTSAGLTPHCDSGDVVALLCVRQARSGGTNVLSSALSVYREIQATEPWRLEVLHRGFFYNIRGNGPPGDFRDITSHRVPVYSQHAGRLSCRFNQKAILTSERLPGAPPLTELERSSVELVATLASDPRFSIEVRLEPGDLLLLSNHSVLHNRREFKDGHHDGHGRLLLRKWINLPHGRELTWEFGDHYNTGIRQGPFVDRTPA